MLCYNKKRNERLFCLQFSDFLIIVSIFIIASSVSRAPRWSIIYYILLAAIGAVSGVFAYYPHPGGQA